jgi:hypothetical protein
MTQDERTLIEGLEDHSLPPASLDHATHVKLGWLYLRRDPLLTALDRFRRALQSYVTAHGQAGKYHETITWAYLVLIHERMERHGSAQTWAEFAANNTDLLGHGKSVLASYYQSDTLTSELARRIFVLPDARAKGS